MSQGPLVAIVDDDDSIRSATENLLEAAGYSTTTFSSAEGLMSSERRNDVSCVVTDMRMPGMTGLELFEALESSGRAIPTVLITAYPDEQGILCYLSKPFSPEELCACVDAALARAR